MCEFYSGTVKFKRKRVKQLLNFYEEIIDEFKTKDKVIFLDWNGTLSDSFFWEHMRTSNEKEIKNLYNIWDQACLINLGVYPKLDER